jgi:hypothetical protein
VRVIERFYPWLKQDDKLPEAWKTCCGFKNRTMVDKIARRDMGLSYTYEKLHLATRALATGANDIRDRLESAAISTMMLDVSPQDQQFDFPTPELRDKFRSVRERMTRVEARGDEGRIRATLRTLSDEEAEQIATDLFDLFVDIAERDAEANAKRR